VVVPSSFCLEQPNLFPAEEEFEKLAGNRLESLLEELLEARSRSRTHRRCSRKLSWIPEMDSATVKDVSAGGVQRSRMKNAREGKRSG
jgi:hypothetical protein